MTCIETRAAALQLTIAGRGVDGKGAALDIVDPSTGAVFAQAPCCSVEQLDEAVTAARAGARLWAAVPFGERKAKVAAIAPLILAHAETFMDLLGQEQGKPRWLAEGEVRGAAAWAAAAADFVLPEESMEDGRGGIVTIQRVPVGIVAGIIPWNYPLLTAIMKIVPALTAGNALLLKPAPTTPFSALYLGELLRGHFPPGVLNILSGGDALGPMLVEHEGIDKISFTGSTAVGKKIMRAAADRLKRVTLELGGNDPAIILADADIAAAAEQIFWGAFRNSGQVCVATKRVYAHADIFDGLFAALTKLAREIPMGSWTDPEARLGPIQNKAQFDRVKALADGARAAGLTLVEGAAGGNANGYFFPVTLVEDPPEQAPVVQEEAFGPILPVMRFTDVEDVIARANGTRFGLGASVWSRDVEAARKIAARLESGTVWVNQAGGGGPTQPLAGHKESGIGVENGSIGMLDYMLVRVTTVPAATA
ncbi:aldehyde dehydrogenase family protein [Sphingopyxis sp.]|uniref:aldehyde dehydrogenase family protein n=1 Tax=Sphingopyxis sp. TaxID=1908224 RepID=UPI003BAA76A6